ncbi:MULTISPECIES: DUF4209 domain-containing protein [unclassified Mesorhizobium]|uniref:DUF4209 domain-containing protein n=3 Tax=Mesorhizobium TaxID=68287 RepID=UPI0016720A34|nr:MULTISPECIES: DUF4209 domain-containing protein [unclassified Mesorhizobium]
MVPDDLDDRQIEAFRETLEAIEDAEFRARVGDVIWLRKRDAKAARIAVEAYVNSGSRLEDLRHWPPSMKRYERAARLAKQVGGKSDLSGTVLEHIESRVRYYDGADPLYFTCKALELLSEFKFGEFLILAGIAGRVGAKSRADGDFRRSRSYFDVQAKLLVLAKDEDAAEAARIMSSETFVEEAEAREAAGSAMAAHSFWQDAIRAFRERPTLRARIPELQKRLAAAGKQTLAEMKNVSHEIDIRELVEQTEKEFRGLQSDEAVLKFAIYNQLIDPKRLREEAIKSMEDHPLQSAFAASIYDEAGRKIAVRPALMGADEKNREIAIEGFMDQHARISRSIAVAGALAPAMRTILFEHEICEQDVERLIKGSKFVPEGRMPLLVKAIAEGFRWDFCTALHLFVPQVENGLRHLLEQSGEIPRNIDANGIEEVWGLERTLANPFIQKELGDEFIFELQSLLAGRLGPNIRNSLAHGLLSANSFRGEAALYLWWVLFRLTIMPTPAIGAYITAKLK